MSENNTGEQDTLAAEMSRAIFLNPALAYPPLFPFRFYPNFDRFRPRHDVRTNPDIMNAPLPLFGYSINRMTCREKSSARPGDATRDMACL